MSGFEVPRTPVEVVRPFAESIIRDRRFEEFRNTTQESRALLEMNYLLNDFDMLGGYSVRTNLAFVLPEELEPDAEGLIHGVRMERTTGFEGELIGSRSLKIGRILGHESVRAICLTFEDVELQYRTTVNSAVVPYYTHIESDEQMYVQVFAVENIQQI